MVCDPILLCYLWDGFTIHPKLDPVNSHFIRIQAEIFYFSTGIRCGILIMLGRVSGPESSAPPGLRRAGLQTVEKPRRRLLEQSSGGRVKGAKSPLRVQSTRIFKLFQKFENTHSVAKRLFRHAEGAVSFRDSPLRV